MKKVIILIFSVIIILLLIGIIYINDKDNNKDIKNKMRLIVKQYYKTNLPLRLIFSKLSIVL